MNLALLLALAVSMADEPPPPAVPTPTREAPPAESPPADAPSPAGDVPVTGDEPAPPASDAPADIGPLPGVTPASAPPTRAEADALAREIGSGLRCPVCQGLSVADSGSSAAVLMQRRILELVSQGYTRIQIEDYFVERYGEWVLLSPRADGFNQVVWIGPLLAFGIGLLASLAFLRRGSDPAPRAPEQPLTTQADSYEQRILSEADDD